MRVTYKPNLSQEVIVLIGHDSDKWHQVVVEVVVVVSDNTDSIFYSVR